MTISTPATIATKNSHANKPANQALVRIKSADLFKAAREIEIDHEGRIYRMRLTNLNKLILTA
ncbi:MAG: hemin uptake protein HemP [Burkholderiales bacterium]|nr:hemin uptake protein HemP [Burkholderiales bacterium]